VNNDTTRSTHHPTVHYIFADDDPDILTQALANQHLAGTTNPEDSDTNPEHSHISANTTRAVVLDVAPTADGTSWEVSWASSLSPDWAVVGAQISRIEDVEDGDDAPGGGLVLKIDGVDHDVPTAGPVEDLPSSGSGAAHISGREDYTALTGEFDKRMAVMRKVVAACEERMKRIGDVGQMTTELVAPGHEPGEEKGKAKETVIGD
jgi:hypothetical protein